MKRVLVLGRGGAGKSTLARTLAAATGLPVVELDKHFWGPNLEATPLELWEVVQGELAAADEWIMDGDLGPYDALAVRLRRADTVLLLDYSFPRCAWQALLRSRENLDFWRWVWSWRRKHRQPLLDAIGAHDVTLHVFRGPRQTARFVREASPSVS
ncbi:hypothetical protein [Lentzea sp. NBRC 102530]|uniref:hypothetical protein n=1 Tax=Lentzea sp. NBRC 102530 TaxID=3032201 RepID=UPI0024A19E99|nr:hypothetical protein [Lentzea sp. NBRC 102530]GLY50464.1 topology modulation protein [Lentzea sp. NBRC 102530]